MITRSGWLLVGAAFALIASDATAQFDPFKPPQTPAEYWAAIKYEITVGKYDRAGTFLKGFLATSPTDADLLAVEKKDGMSGVLELRLVEKWSDKPQEDKDAKANVEKMIELVGGAVRKQRLDPARIARFVKNLTGTPEEAAFAENELRLAGAAAMPALIQELRITEDGLERAAILRTFSRLPGEVVPPLLAALDINDPTRKAEMILALGNRRDLTALAARADTNPAPALFHLAASTSENPSVRNQAAQLAARLRGVDVSALPLATDELIRAGNQLYRHAGKLPANLNVWKWTGDNLVATPHTASQAEEYLGLRALRWALEIEPANEAAQQSFASLAVEKAIERGGSAEALAKTAPATFAAIAALPTKVLADTLNRALKDQRSSTALGLTQIIGSRADRETVAPGGVLLKALEYPDRRVQLAAAEAILNAPVPPANAANKVIDTLRRALSGDTAGGQVRALIGDSDRGRGENLAQKLRLSGVDGEVVQTGRELMQRLGRAADVDLLVLHAKLTYPELPELLGSLRADTRSGLVRTYVVLPDDESSLQQDARERRLRQVTRDDSRIRYVRGTLSGEALADGLSAADTPYTEAEKKAAALRAVTALRKAASLGWNIAAADVAVRAALQKDDLALVAAQVAGATPTKESQQDLTAVAAAATRKPEIRAAAAAELVNHVQRFGASLDEAQVQALLKAADAAETPADVKEKVAAAIGALRLTPALSGARLSRYQPPVAAAAPPANPPAAAPAKPAPPKKEDE